jgi:secondary thiamine-phosphate synthase enzyme
MALDRTVELVPAPRQSDRLLDDYGFAPGWLPGLAPELVDTSTTFLGRALAAPIALACGDPRTGETARRLGLGVVLEVPAAQALRHPDELGRLARRLGADAALVQIDLLDENPADGVLPDLPGRLRQLCGCSPVPVLVEEVGYGLSPAAAERLLGSGVAGVAVTGRERSRASAVRSLDIEPADFAEALSQTRRVAAEAVVLAANGAADGVDVAKEIALGADLVLFSGGPSAARQAVSSLRAAMCRAGASTVAELRAAPLVRRSQSGLVRTHVEQLACCTNGGCEFIDLTQQVCDVVARAGVRQGLVHVFAHHTTAAVRVNENEPLLLGDIRRFLDRLAPEGGYEHDDLSRRLDIPPDEPINGHSHCRQLLLGGGETLPVLDGRVALGRWQRIFLIELDGARTRQVTVQVLGAG